MLTYTTTSIGGVYGLSVTGQVAPLKTDIVIPNTSYYSGQNLPVIKIREYAFNENQLTSVVIPDSVITIEQSAFASNQLTSVVIPDSVTTIEYGAFQDNQLTSVVIPDSVTSIEPFAFGSNQLTSVVIPNGVTSIGQLAFGSNQLTSVVIPDSVTTIEDGVFQNNPLINVILGSKIINIPLDSFKSTEKINYFAIKNLNSIVELSDVRAFGTLTASDPMNVYVLSDFIEDYKVATNWSTLYNDGKIIFKELTLFRQLKNIYYNILTPLGELSKIKLVTQETIDKIKNKEEQCEDGVLYFSNESDYTAEEKTKLAGIEAGAQVNPVNSDFTLAGLGEKSFASLTNKPTTIADYGITNAYTKVEIDNMVGDIESLLMEV